MGGAGALCPPMCNKATGKVVKEADGETTTNEVHHCGRHRRHEEPDHRPANYKAMGTNNKIPAGHTASICRMVCNTEQGWAAASGATMPGSSPACAKYKNPKELF